MTSFIGLIGYPLGHSISPLFQQAAFDHLRLDIRYEAWEVEPAKLREVIGGLRHPSRLGLNVTVPYKESVLPHLDRLDSQASQVGAVNTVVKQGQRLIGYNTDAEGFLKALRQDGAFEPRDKRAVLLGAGGVARAVGFGLARAGASRLIIVNRTPARAAGLASELRRFGPEVTAVPWRDEGLGEALAGCDLLVNCTSIGMKHSGTEGRSPLASEFIPQEALIYDVVYNPLETPFLAEAKRAGARTLGGLPMLVYQGAASFELWTGRKAPIDIMLAAAKKAL
jgi:shikimate dehydrogenase